MSKTHCPDCQSQDVITTENFMTVCTDCGSVVNDIPESIFHTNTLALNSDGNKFGSRSFSKQTNNGQSSPSIPVAFGIDLIHTVCKNMNIAKNIRDKSINLLREVVFNEQFKHCFTNAKQTLALCCLYLICNQEDNPIMLTELAANTDCIFNHLGSILLRLQKIYPEKCQHNIRNIESHIPFYLFKFDFDDKEKQPIAHYATNLVWMWREALLVQGCHPIPVINVALFYAWKAIDRSRASILLKEFCDEFKIDYTKSLQSRTNRYYRVLKDFIQCCPLLDDTVVTPRTISLKIEQIISMKRLILLNYNQRKNETNITSQKRSLEAEDCLAVEKEKKEPKDRESGKGEEEVSDSEIDQYIRTDKEVEEIEKLI